MCYTEIGVWDLESLLLPVAGDTRVDKWMRNPSLEGGRWRVEAFHRACAGKAKITALAIKVIGRSSVSVVVRRFVGKMSIESSRRLASWRSRV